MRRLWPYTLVFILLFAGAFWGRRAEVAQRNSARNAADSVDIQFEDDLARTVAELKSCLADGRCGGQGVGFFGAGTIDDTDVDVDLLVAGMIKGFWPEFGGYVDGTLHWNATVRAALADDLSVTDPAALQQTLERGEPELLAALLAEARTQLADRAERGRSLSRVFGWGWQMCLGAMFFLPIVGAIIEIRRLDRAQDGTPNPIIQIGPPA